MGKVTTNTTDRQSEAIPTSVVEIFVMDDFPAPVSSVITLVTNTEYRLKAPLSTGDRFLIPTGGAVDIVAEAGLINSFTYTGVLDLFSSTAAISRLVLENLLVLSTGPGAGIYVLIGDATTGSMRAINSQFLNFATIGTRTGFSFVEDQAVAYANFTIGVTFQDVVTVVMDRALTLMDGTGSGAAVSVLGAATLRAQLDTANITVNGGEDAFFIEPDVDPDAVIIITNALKIGTGDFFKPGVSGTITTITQAAFSSETINSVSDNGSGLARMNFTAPPTLFVDETVVITGFTTNPQYNGTFRIFQTGAGFFDIVVTFAADESGGSFTGDRITCVDIGHGLSEGQSLVIFNSVNYDGPAIIFNVQTNDFQISRTFVIDETAQWDTGSLDETDPRMFVSDNGDQKDSMTIGSLVVGGNTTPCGITTQNVFVDLNLGTPGAVAAGNNERFTVTNGTTGEIRYNGQNPITLNISGLIAASASGGGQRYNFRALKNGATLPVPDNVDVPVEVGNALSATPAMWAITMVKNDLFRMQVANADGTTDITIDTLKYTIT